MNGYSFCNAGRHTNEMENNKWFDVRERIALVLLKEK